MSDLKEKNSGILAWFASNHVAANLLMFLILAGGIMSLMTTTIEIFPNFEVDVITVTVPYLGATPEEAEEGVCLRVEDAVAGIEGVKRLRSMAMEGAGVITIEVEEYADSKEVLDDVKAEVARIITFPKETEKPIITEITTRNQVLNAVIYGDASERTLKSLAENMRDELTAMPNISQVEIYGTRRYEISIEVSEEKLRRYGLSLDQVANAVRQSSLDLPGGSVKTAGGEILIRTKGQKYIGSEFENVAILTRNDGTKVYLSEIADIIDGFEDSDLVSLFDGKRAVMLKIFRVGEQDVLDLAKTSKEYLEKQKTNLPEGVSVATWFDRSDFLRSRISLLNRNAIIGLILVFVCLSLFLELRLAFWTTMGIPISFMGAFWLMPFFDVTINMMSLFAFILALGIVVDDAIVVGENIFSYRQKGMGHIEAAILGVKEMCGPVVMAVLTTIFAFSPLLYIFGVMGKFIRVIPIIVICVLSFSLLEALLILPAHLAGNGKAFRKPHKQGFIGRFQQRLRSGLDKFIYQGFSRLVEKAVAWRYLTIAIGFMVLLGTIGFVKGGHIKFRLFPEVDADNVWASLSMPQGSGVERTQEVVKIIEDAAGRVKRRLDVELGNGGDKPSLFGHIATSIGEQPFTAGGAGGPPGEAPVGAHVAEINIELLGGEYRSVSSAVIAKMWREEVGEIAGVSSLSFTSSLMHMGDAIDVELSHKNFDKLLQAAERLKQILREYDGVTDIEDSFEPGKIELKLKLKEQGRLLNLTLSDLAKQVRQGFYGEEVQRAQRGREDVKVMVRYPKDERKSVADVENMRIRLSNGTEIPFNVVAEVYQGRGYATISRADRMRIVSVKAGVDEKVANATEINKKLSSLHLPKLKEEFGGLIYNFGGEQKEQRDIGASLGSSSLVALLAIFGLLAVLFRSYVQPLIIMSAIPFGLVGAIFGHVIMGYNLSILSVFGIVALTGIVVNDSLIMVDLINRERAEGIEIHQVIKDSATRRFRPILLTTLTTFFGLVPMLLERSLQAKFLIPMAISLAFGVVFATMITLLLVPSLYMILEDAGMALSRKRGQTA